MALHAWRRSVARRSAALAAALLLAGCAAEVVAPGNPFASIPDRSAEVRVGQMERGAVRGQMGEPVLSSRFWRFDLFRSDAEQSSTVVAVTPWPIPIARLKDQLQRYTLVAYDGSGRASAVASGLVRKPAAWRNVSPIQDDFPALHLRAADTLFFVDPEGARDVNLLVAPAGRDAFLEQGRTSNACLAVLGCGARGCADQLSVDGAEARRLPLRNAHAHWLREDERANWLRDLEPHGGALPWLEMLVALRLAPGQHSLEFSAKHLGGREGLAFSCRQGEVAYLLLDAIDNGSTFKRALVDWRIERTDVMPRPFARRPLVLMDDGKWQVEAEPGR